MSNDKIDPAALPHLNTESGTGLPLAALDDRLVRLHGWWRSLRTGGGLPPRKAIDPLEFRFALGHVSLVDVVRGGPETRFGIRLVGDDSDLRLRVRAERDRKPAFVDELSDPDARSLIGGTYARVTREAAASWARRDVVIDMRRRIYDAVWLPFGDDGATVDVIMTGLVYYIPTR